MLHVRLVRAAVREIKQRHSGLYSLTVFADMPEFGRDRPDRCGGFVPDVFAVDTPETCRIIGEAKTPADFETERSQRQIAGFLSHLARFPNSFFYLAIPWRYAPRARSVLASLRDDLGAQAVTVEIIESLD